MPKPDIGAASEYAFAAEMLARGYVPAWPSVETQPYDMVVDTGKNLWKVQVKGSNKTTYKTKGFIDFHFRKRVGKRTRTYNKKDIDFIVFHIHGTQHWYLFPVEEVLVWVRLHPNDDECKYNKYLDAWALLE